MGASRVRGWIRVLSYVLAASLVVVLVCTVTGAGCGHDLRPRLEVRNESADELSNLQIESRLRGRRLFAGRRVAPHSGLSTRVTPTKADTLRAEVEVGRQNRIVTQLGVPYDWDYDLRFVVDSAGAILFSRVEGVRREPTGEDLPRWILLMSGAIVWLLAPAVVALWGWQLLEQKGSLARRTLALLMPPFAALVVLLASVQAVASQDERQVPPPMCGMSVAALMIVGGSWVLIVGSVNAICLIGRWLHRQRSMRSRVEANG